jgi:hypothetical protein
VVTTASKVYFGAAFVAAVAALVYSWGAGGGLEGPVTLGMKGGIGELGGYIVLMTTALVMALLGVAASILRDADPEVAARVARLEEVPPVTPPEGATYWPALGAAAAVTAAVGLVASPVMFVIGLIAAGLVLLEWMVQAWSDRATGDPAVNRRIRNRLMYPIEIPLIGALAIGTLVVSISRVLLATSATASWIIASAVGVIIFLTAVLLAYRPGVSKDAIAVVLVLFMAMAIGAGIAAAAAGHRTFGEGEGEGTELDAGTSGSEG